jgi:HAD superfamily hydrolase (TIGR01490 family)
MTDAKKSTAAFYDVDGTLIRTNIVHTYAYYALHSAHPSERLSKTAGLLATLPFYWAADKLDRYIFNEHFYKNYEGISEDRLHVLGDEIFEKIIKPNIYPGAASLIARSKEQGHRQILVSGALDVVTRQLAEHLGFDDFMSNRLELQDGFATGRLLRPFVAGPAKAMLVRKYAEEHNIDLDKSFAYADSGSDLPMLSVVGYPCAVNPDFRMRTTAHAHGWPVLTLEDAR